MADEWEDDEVDSEEAQNIERRQQMRGARAAQHAEIHANDEPAPQARRGPLDFNREEPQSAAASALISCHACSQSGASKVCSKCKRGVYCDEKCQKKHFKKHQKECRVKK